MEESAHSIEEYTEGEPSVECILYSLLQEAKQGHEEHKVISEGSKEQIRYVLSAIQGFDKAKKDLLDEIDSIGGGEDSHADQTEPVTAAETFKNMFKLVGAFGTATIGTYAILTGLAVLRKAPVKLYFRFGPLKTRAEINNPNPTPPPS